MKASLILFLFSIMIFSSCQKEIDWGLGTAADKLLIKISSKTGTDSTIVTYDYNSGKQLIHENTTGISGTTVVDNDLKIYRTGTGIIDRAVQVAAGLVSAGIDSVVIKYTYDATLSRYSYSVFNIVISGNAIKDSTVYTYDASGMITMDESYLKTGILPAILSLKNQYTYSSDGLSLLTVQTFAPTMLGGPLTLSSTETFTYDSKKSPLILKREAILLLRTGLYSTQNAKTAVLVNAIDPAADFSLDISYKYNSSNKPDSSYSAKTPGGMVTASKYFYQ